MPHNDSIQSGSASLPSTTQPAHASATSVKHQRTAALIAILCGGLIAGTIDIGSASLINWLSPIVILHTIASGILGSASFSYGWNAAVLGLILQWVMSLLIAVIYVGAASRISWLKRQWIPAGVIYGIVIFVVMNYVVVPLSAAPFKPHFIISKIIENLLAMILFGLIVAYFTHFFTRTTSSK